MAVLFFVGSAGADEITRDDLGDLPAVQIVLLGEVHDNADHHINQAEALRALQPAAVVFEMLTADQAEIANATTARDAALADALGWADSGWPDFALYQPVFEAVGDARIYGMAVPRADLRAVFEVPLPEAFGPEAARFALDQTLDPDTQAAREAFQMAAHCDALPPELLPGMVAAQRFRDAAFSRRALQALEETGGPVAVIAGSGHVRKDWGMPAALAVVAPEVDILAIGQVEDPASDLPPFDLWLRAPAAERDDPCAAFRSRG